MKTNLCLVMAFFMTLSIASGQDYTFKVLAVKGDNKVRSGAVWKPLRTGLSLTSKDELILSDNSYLGLVHSSGKTMELKKAGNHKVSELAVKISSSGSGVTNKYADFVLSKMSAEGKKNRLSATGAVHRGPENFKVYIPTSTHIFNDKIIIRWDSLEGAQTYTVTLKNMFNDELLSIKTKDCNIELDLTDSKLAKENVILLNVVNEENLGVKTNYAIKKLTQDEANPIKTDLNELMVNIEEPTALNQFILAGFYEEGGLLVDALTSYEKAVRMAPDVNIFQEAYSDFLIRNRLISEIE